MIVSNGVDTHTGKPLIEIEEDELAALIAADGAPDPHDEFGTKPGGALPWEVVPTDVGQAGWSIVFANGESDAVKEALAPLVAHRLRQVGPDNFHLHDHFGGEDVVDWLARYNVNPGTIDPSRVGYYVLLVGSPARIPFEFQYLLDIEYAVGRIAFDSPEEYGQYARSVVASETTGPVRDKVTAYWGPRHPWDVATKLSADTLLRGLAPGAGDRTGTAERNGFRSVTRIGDDASKAALLDLLAGRSDDAGRPGLLMTASHGLGGLAPDDPDQRDRHGALLTQDWKGGPVGADVTLAGADVAAAKVHGMIAFVFACYGGGTPMIDNFPGRGKTAQPIAAEAFVARLPQRLLAHPDGGALAVIGHVERAWGYSITSSGGSQLKRFDDILGQLMHGTPVGHSMRMFNDAYAILSTALARRFKLIADGTSDPAPRKLLSLWMECTDVQNYVVLGDPAASLRS